MNNIKGKTSISIHRNRSCKRVKISENKDVIIYKLQNLTKSDFYLRPDGRYEINEVYNYKGLEVDARVITPSMKYYNNSLVFEDVNTSRFKMYKKNKKIYIEFQQACCDIDNKESFGYTNGIEFTCYFSGYYDNLYYDCKTYEDKIKQNNTPKKKKKPKPPKQKSLYYPDRDYSSISYSRVNMRYSVTPTAYDRETDQRSYYSIHNPYRAF